MPRKERQSARKRPGETSTAAHGAPPWGDSGAGPGAGVEACPGSGSGSGSGFGSGSGSGSGSGTGNEHSVDTVSGTGAGASAGATAGVTERAIRQKKCQQTSAIDWISDHSQDREKNILDIAEGFVERLYRDVRVPSSTSASKVATARAGQLSAALQQHKRDMAELKVDKGTNPNLRGLGEGASARPYMIMQEQLLSDWVFYVRPTDILRSIGSDTATGVAIRARQQRSALIESGYVELQFSFVPPKENAAAASSRGASMSAPEDDVASAVRFYRTVLDIAQLPGDNRGALRRALDEAPAFMRVASTSAGAGAAVEGAPSEQSLVIPLTIDVAAIATVGDLTRFVECEPSGMIFWCGEANLALRKRRWKDQFGAEQKKIPVLLGAYCHAKLFGRLPAEMLGSKQRLVTAANTEVEKRAELKAVKSAEGWFGVAKYLKQNI